jgi:hypothetical protein
MTHSSRRFCARLLALVRERHGSVLKVGPNGLELRHESEQFRSAILSGLGHHEVEMSIPAFSFRSSELSQPI